MNEVRMIDWDLVQLQYEVLHESVINLAESYDVSEEAIEYAIDTRGWKQKPYSDIISSWKDLSTLEDKTDGIITALQHRNQIIQLLKIQNFNARYTQLEAAAITKMYSIMDNIVEDHPDAPKMVKEIVSAMTDLKTLSESGVNGGSATDGSDPAKFEININAVATPSKEENPPIDVN